jgi:hypothetical protein
MRVLLPISMGLIDIKNSVVVACLLGLSFGACLSQGG